MQTIDNLEALVPLLAGITERNAFCKVILDNVPAKLKTPLGRAARDFYGHKWSDSSFANGLSPSTHNGTAKTASAVYSRVNRKVLLTRKTLHRQENRLEVLIGSCKARSKFYGRSFTEADAQQLRDLWSDAQAGNTPWTGLLEFAAFGE